MFKQGNFYSQLVLAGFFVLYVSLFNGQLVAKNIAGPSASKEIELIMFKSEGCHFCDSWNKKIGGFYDETSEGRFAPLRRVDIHRDDLPKNVKPVVFTPTFVLYKKGREVGRIIGYNSEDFFWGMLSVLLKDHGYEDGAQENTVQKKDVRLQ